MPSFIRCSLSSLRVLRSIIYMRLSVDECSAAITLIGIIYQYLCIKIIRFSGSRQMRKSLRACLSVLLSEISSVVTPDDTHSASSSRTAAVCPEPLLSAVFSKNLLSERLRVILPRNADSFFGFCGGIAFHAFISVSFTHSSQSSFTASML